MKQVTVNIYTFSELSKESQDEVRKDFSDFIEDFHKFQVTEIKASLDTFLDIYIAGGASAFFGMDAQQCQLTGVCYDIDFMELLEKHKGEDLRPHIRSTYRRLVAASKRDVYSTEYLDDAFQANEIEFLQNGKQFNV